MTPQSLADRLLSPGGFGLALLLFLLPFATVSCTVPDDQAPFTLTYTFSGLDLVTGGAPAMDGVIPDDDGSPTVIDGVTDDAGFAQQYGRPVQPLAVVTAVTLLVGMIGSFALPVALRGRVSAAAALGALVLLLVEVLAIVPDRAAAELARVAPESGLALRTTPALGFYLTGALLIALVVREYLVVARRPPPIPASAPSTDATWPPAG